MLTREQIRETLEAAGLTSGCHLLVHSSLRRLGPVDGGGEAVIAALRDVVGPHGTLAMPAFNGITAIAQPFFDVRTTPGATGVLGELFRRQPDVLRSYHPTHSIAACGPRAQEFLADHYLVDVFGVGSPIDRLAHAGGFTLLLGVTQTANSCIHVGESHAGATKFFWHDGELPIIPLRLPDGNIRHHRLDCSSSCSMAFNALEFPLRQRGAIIDLRLGSALCYLMRAMDVIETAAAVVETDPFVLLCTRPQCRPCSMRRRFLRQQKEALPNPAP